MNKGYMTHIHFARMETIDRANMFLGSVYHLCNADNGYGFLMVMHAMQHGSVEFPENSDLFLNGIFSGEGRFNGQAISTSPLRKIFYDADSHSFRFVTYSGSEYCWEPYADTCKDIEDFQDALNSAI